LVEVKSGSFYMGTSNAEAARAQAEYERHQLDPALAKRLVDRQQPQRKVKIEGFYLGKREVTQAQWRAVAALPKVRLELNPDPSFFKGDDLPVEQVSWEEAVEFCERLARATGRQYRLPSEAEWEYAARAGSDSAFAFGETLKTEVANYHGGYRFGIGPAGQYRQTTIKAGSLNVANAFGLFDLHGNVAEWVEDVWRDGYRDAPVDGRAWTGDGDERSRVIRGGSWNDRSSHCRSAHRTRYESYLYSNTIGFRVALTAPRSGK
jgi:formylglycine-generating enzyme required for sulfatase activity